jgi:hypothetical protein
LEKVDAKAREKSASPVKAPALAAVKSSTDQKKDSPVTGRFGQSPRRSISPLKDPLAQRRGRLSFGTGNEAPAPPPPMATASASPAAVAVAAAKRREASASPVKEVGEDDAARRRQSASPMKGVLKMPTTSEAGRQGKYGH